MRVIQIFALVLAAGFLPLHAQDAEPTFGHVALTILPTSSDADLAEATKVFKELMEAMKAAPGCVGGYISKGPIRSPAGFTDYQLIMATFWESNDNFMDFLSSGGSEKFGPELSAMDSLLLAYPVEQ